MVSPSLSTQSSLAAQKTSWKRTTVSKKPSDAWRMTVRLNSILVSSFGAQSAINTHPLSSPSVGAGHGLM